VNSTVLVVVIALAMAVGVVGTVVPFVPGLGLVWLAALLYGLVEGFGVVGFTVFFFMTALAVAGAVAGVVVPQRAASRGGAHQAAILAGGALGVVGFFVVPVVGLPLGFVIGVLLAEWIRTRAWSLAWRATLATLRGLGLATLAQFVMGLSMVALWVVWVLAT
jgi:uncharacterized protein YqgC (DUF456 family)